MKKKIITKISEGLGNQLFMYANSYSLSKKNNFNLYIDTLSGYYQNKHIYEFILDRFNISAKKANYQFTFGNFHRNLFKKVLIFYDRFNKKKNSILKKKILIK